MKLSYLAIIFVFVSTTAPKAQPRDTLSSNSLALEIGKASIVSNLVYDHTFRSGRTGFRVFAGSNLNRYLPLAVVGAGAYWLAGKKSHFLEIGTDLSYLAVAEVSDDQRTGVVYPDHPIKTVYATLNAGYRGCFNRARFRIGLAPGFTKEEFLAGAYISLGYAIH